LRGCLQRGFLRGRECLFLRALPLLEMRGASTGISKPVRKSKCSYKKKNAFSWRNQVGEKESRLHPRGEARSYGEKQNREKGLAFVTRSVINGMG